MFSLVCFNFIIKQLLKLRHTHLFCLMLSVNPHYKQNLKQEQWAWVLVRIISDSMCLKRVHRSKKKWSQFPEKEREREKRPILFDHQWKTFANNLSLWRCRSMKISGCLRALAASHSEASVSTMTDDHRNTCSIQSNTKAINKLS